ncbi:hypothetical protein [Calditerrivibrio nitroreducens]|uniref:Endonuclease/exonuclease/phosphatase n=1 Tax=Calditerrivibrio nitroreducens (strain DSM 19672 / NBRC 101217 / Yu37-1) TaxID=768670 RepID=E4TFD8_CALNY|nr:hypothetical protein [Calditerrivibrio nitroreducens]ADR19511.1 hypothetical protein Calni_1603 [Calditerrivibrio nitroreducens DSM 19672]
MRNLKILFWNVKNKDAELFHDIESYNADIIALSEVRKFNIDRYQSFFEKKGFNYFTSLDLFDDIALSNNTNLLMVAGKGISLDNLKLSLDELGEHRLKFMQVSTEEGLKLGVYHSMNCKTM